MLFSAVFVELCGIALVQWSVPLPGDEINADVIDPTDIKQGDYNREQYFHKKIMLIEKGNENHAHRKRLRKSCS